MDIHQQSLWLGCPLRLLVRDYILVLVPTNGSFKVSYNVTTAVPPGSSVIRDRTFRTFGRVASETSSDTSTSRNDLGFLPHVLRNRPVPVHSWHDCRSFVLKTGDNILPNSRPRGHYSELRYANSLSRKDSLSLPTKLTICVIFRDLGFEHGAFQRSFPSRWFTAYFAGVMGALFLLNA